MTDRRRAVLAFIQGYVRDNGLPPTMREISENVDGMQSRSVAHDEVQALVQDGHLEARLVRGVTAYFPVESSAAA